MDKPCSFMSCDKLDRVELCSCINLGTTDIEGEEEAKERSLMLSRSVDHDGFYLDAQPLTNTVSNVNKLQQGPL